MRIAGNVDVGRRSLLRRRYGYVNGHHWLSWIGIAEGIRLHVWIVSRIDGLTVLIVLIEAGLLVVHLSNNI